MIPTTPSFMTVSRHMSRANIPYSQEELYATCGPREYSGAALREIAFPLGGIGTGTVSLGGRGELRDWEIFNRPAKGRSLPFTFFSLWAQPAGGDSIARVLERQLLPPFVADRGLPPWGVA